MSDLTAKFAQLEALMTTQHNAVMSSLDSIFNTLDTINNNASGNTQAILAALADNSCVCDPNAPLTPSIPPITPFPVTDALCKRNQAFLDLYRFGYGVPLSAYIQQTGSISASVASTLLSQALASAGVTEGALFAGMPQSTAQGIASAVRSAIDTLGASTVAGALLAGYNDDSVWGLVRDDIFTADSPLDALNAAHSRISTAIVEPLIANIINSAFYSAWIDDILVNDGAIDDSGYSGSVCAIPPCVVFGSTVYTGYYGGRCWDVRGLFNVSYDTNPDQLGLQRCAYDFNAYTMEVLSGGSGIEFRSDAGNIGFTGSTITIPWHTSDAFVICPTSSGPFTIRVCAPIS